MNHIPSLNLLWKRNLKYQISTFRSQAQQSKPREEAVNNKRTVIAILITTLLQIKEQMQASQHPRTHHNHRLTHQLGIHLGLFLLRIRKLSSKCSIHKSKLRLIIQSIAANCRIQVQQMLRITSFPATRYLSHNNFRKRKKSHMVNLLKVLARPMFHKQHAVTRKALSKVSDSMTQTILANLKQQTFLVF